MRGNCAATKRCVFGCEERFARRRSEKHQLPCRRSQLRFTPKLRRLEACAGLLRSMASEEAARLAWVRHHLQKGEVDAARELGWRPDGGEEGAAPPTPPSRLALSVD